MRYTTVEASAPGKWYVYDTLKGQLVWSTARHSDAIIMTGDLNEIHEKAPAPAGVPKILIARVRTGMAVDELNAVKHSDKAIACLESGDGKGADENGKLVKELRQRAQDMRVLLTALGIPLEG